MNILRRILNAVEAITLHAAEALQVGRPIPVKIPARAPHLTYSLSRRQRLEWMHYVCNRRH